jgi:hypothetical protein
VKIHDTTGNPLDLDALRGSDDEHDHDH